MEYTWNPWHGCQKISDGCKNCYMYTSDIKKNIDSTKVRLTSNVEFPIRRNRYGEYKVKSGDMVYLCFTSDFLIEEADVWRERIWDIIYERHDVKFLFLTKRIHRLKECLPHDWGDGYDNVAIGCTCENQEMADFRLPIFLSIPIKRRFIICEPLLGSIDLMPYLDNSKIYSVNLGGESGLNARLCDYDVVLDIKQQCEKTGVGFIFHQTGARLKIEDKVYYIKRKYQHSQAKRAKIDIVRDEIE